jgi:SAM-dependent methyltransferase
VTPERREEASLEARRSLRAWLRRAPGSLVLEAERRRLEAVLPDLFGFHLLQVEHLGDTDLVAASRVRHRMVMGLDDPPAGVPYPFIRASGEAMPIAADSVDVVVLPHVLEFQGNPHQTLREVERVLVPEGHVVITGFNPLSLLGLRRLLPGRKRHAPWSGSFLASIRVRDWLALLGFEVVYSGSCFYRPPFGNRRLMDRLGGMERLDGSLWELFGGVYVVVGRKRAVTLTPLRPSWRARSRLLPGGLAEPTARAAVDGQRLREVA